MPEIINPFLTDNTLSLASLTTLINEQKYIPLEIEKEGLFTNEPIATTTAIIEYQTTSAGILEIKPRGSADGKVITADNGRSLPVTVPHIPTRAQVHVNEFAGIREFGSVAPRTFESVLAKKIAKMKMSMMYTIEKHRLAALLGNFYDSNNRLVSLATYFGYTPPAATALATATSTTKYESVFAEIKLKVEAALDGTPFSGIDLWLEDSVFVALKGHPNIQKYYLNTPSAPSLNADPLNEFNVMGMRVKRYRGSSECKIPVGEGIAIPRGVPDMYMTYYAPGTGLGMENTMGLPFYAYSKEIDTSGLVVGVELGAQSNPLNIVTRPAIVKLTI